ncbi:unnamed protein product [Soboliphyme baturini]|uniref:60S ribosomal protein L21 n=1 Tax=Soboliphyme baturini TaxID=241478 RepID=A0A183J9I0_9BILA|nr:unnamed protein product [Soboliphyme baturini]
MRITVQNIFRHRVIPKRINVRVEHVKPSKCRDDFLKRVKRNAELRKISKETGQRFCLKRKPAEPPLAHFIHRVKKHPPKMLEVLPYQYLI